MPTNVIMPQMGESIAEGTITKWLKKVGERVERDEPLFEISTDKVDAEIPSPAAGVLAKILVQENETVPVNAVVALIDGGGAEVETGKVEGTQAGKNLAAPAAVSPPAPTAVAAPPGPAPSARGRGEKVRSSPLVRRLAREDGVDLSLGPVTGVGGGKSKKGRPGGPSRRA